MMQLRARKSRGNPLRPKLTLEPLEDRLALAGNVGIVKAVLNPGPMPNGLLQIRGDSGPNGIRLSSPAAGILRVAGGPAAGIPNNFTSVNGVSFVDFSLGQVVSISITMGTGADTVLVLGFNIPGNFTADFNGGSNRLTVTTFNSNTLTYVGGADGDTVSLDTVKNGQTLITTGDGSDAITVTKATTGTATIITANGDDSTSVTGSRIGSLSITEGTQVPVPTSNDTVSVTGNTMGKATINIFNIKHDDEGVERVTVSNNTFTSNAANAAGLPGGSIPVGGIPLSAPPTLNINVNANPTTGVSLAATAYNVTVSNNSFATGAPAVLYNGSLKVQLGDAIIPDSNNVISTLTVSQISGVNDVTVRTGSRFIGVTLDTLTARQLNANIGANVNVFVLTNTTVAGPVDLRVGDQYTTVLLNNVLVSVTPIDLALGRAADLSLRLGDAGFMNMVTLSNLNIGRNLSVSNGSGDTMFTILNAIVGQDFLIGGDGRDTGQEIYFFTNVKVLNALLVSLGSGLKSVSAQNTTAAFGMIGAVANSVFWDQGNNDGFFVDGFDGFLLGAPEA